MVIILFPSKSRDKSSLAKHVLLDISFIRLEHVINKRNINFKEKTTSLKKCGPKMWLCLFTFQPITLNLY